MYLFLNAASSSLSYSYVGRTPLVPGRFYTDIIIRIPKKGMKRHYYTYQNCSLIPVLSACLIVFQLLHQLYLNSPDNWIYHQGCTPLAFVLVNQMFLHFQSSSD